MNDYKFDTIVDLQGVVDNFYDCPKGIRLTVTKRVINRLNEIGGYVNVFNDNPILFHKSDRFIIKYRDIENPFMKYSDVLRNDKYNYNKTVFNDIEIELRKCKGMSDLIGKSRYMNHCADTLYNYHYDAVDFTFILNQACSKLSNFYLNGSDLGVCREAMNEIEYMLSLGYLTGYHIKRHLLHVKMLRDMSLYKSLDTEGIGDRIDNIFNMSDVKRDDDIFDFLGYGNRTNQIEFYMKMQKRTHEQTFVNSNLYSNEPCHKKDNNKINVNGMEEVYEFFKNQPNLKTLITSDVFRLRTNGFANIEEFRTPRCIRLTCYRNNDVDSLILKSTLDDNVFFFISRNKKGELKKFKVDLKPRPKMDSDAMDRMVESMLINPNKMNRI